MQSWLTFMSFWAGQSELLALKTQFFFSKTKSMNTARVHLYLIWRVKNERKEEKKERKKNKWNRQEKGVCKYKKSIKTDKERQKETSYDKKTIKSKKHKIRKCGISQDADE